MQFLESIKEISSAYHGLTPEAAGVLCMLWAASTVSAGSILALFANAWLTRHDRRLKSAEANVKQSEGHQLLDTARRAHEENLRHINDTMLNAITLLSSQPTEEQVNTFREAVLSFIAQRVFFHWEAYLRAMSLHETKHTCCMYAKQKLVETTTSLLTLIDLLNRPMREGGLNWSNRTVAKSALSTTSFLVAFQDNWLRPWPRRRRASKVLGATLVALAAGGKTPTPISLAAKNLLPALDGH